ncbi:MAG: hypothetical protein ACYS8Z_08080 [Planctomycetota bacterium]|jgi:hypothetical protein
MNGTHDKRIAVRAQVAFLALFVLALVTARFVVALRTAVALGHPIELEHSGFSVRMPQGNGWNSPRGWDYSDGKVSLLGTFAPGSWKATALAKCSYVFSAEILSLEEQFERRRPNEEGEIVESGRIETESAVVDWIRLGRAGGYIYIFGTADIPDHRRIEIEVWESAGDLDLAEGVFKAIASTIKLTPSPPFESGAKMVAKMKDVGLGEALENYNSQSLFLIRDAMNRQKIIGFTTDVLIDAGRAKELNIEAVGLYYTTGISPREEVTSFESDNRFDRFVWSTESAARERTKTEVILEDDAILTITRIGSPLSEISPQSYRYRASRATVPKMLLEQLLARIIEEGGEEAVVDIVTRYGSIVPTHISQIRPESTTDAEDAAYLVKLTPLDARGFFQFTYLDDQRRILKSFVQGRNTLLFERKTLEEAQREFPEISDFIRGNERLKKYLDGMI